ncbi:MAG: GNAT family N-acetyltransferase [Treponema sp.]|jgi:ribosomal protein S18 acetylase RimI-like enzyme|nr:GNAT family N-acetyltransferase [Treponema sp.]
MRSADEERCEQFLRDRELSCVNACYRFLHRDSSRDLVWLLRERPGRAANSNASTPALLIHSHGILFPVMGGDRRDIPAPGFLDRFIRRVHIHAVQGLREDARFMEALLRLRGAEPADIIDYDLMKLGQGGFPAPESLRAGPVGLELRKALVKDAEALFPLQAAYEREEVLPRGAGFSPEVCRLNLARLLANQTVLAAWLDGRLVGKINTNARAFSCTQIGGVYVLPEYRRQGIAARMTAALAAELAAAGRTVTLFVKKRNQAARRVYLRTGFVAVGDYRISYY